MTAPRRIVASHASVMFEGDIERRHWERIVAKERPTETPSAAAPPRPVKTPVAAPAPRTQSVARPKHPSRPRSAGLPTTPSTTTTPLAGAPAAATGLPIGSLILSPDEVATLDELLASHPALARKPTNRTARY